MKLQEIYSKYGKYLVQVSVNLLVSTILLFGFPGKYIECLLLPWIIWVIGFIGYIPFAGFLLFYWAHTIIVLDGIWVNVFGLVPNTYTSALFWIWIALCGLRTLEITARVGRSTLNNLRDESTT